MPQPFGNKKNNTKGGGGRARSGFRPPAEKPEYDQKILSIRRVTRVVAGGRRFSFSVTLAAGNRQGKVGFGVGKSSDVSQAIDKAMKQAKKRLITVPLTKEQSLPHETAAKFGSSQVAIWPARGRGLVAGSSVRAILELVGARDVAAKVFSKSKNKMNIAAATIKALAQIKK